MSEKLYSQKELEDCISRTRKEAEEKGRSAALDEAIGVVDGPERKCYYAGEDRECRLLSSVDSRGRCINCILNERDKVILSALNALKGKGLNGMIGT